MNGAIDYIRKPFNKNELLIKLSNILKVRQEQQRRYIEQFQTNTKNPETIQEEVNPFVEQFMSVMEECYAESQVSVELLAQKMNVSALSGYKIWLAQYNDKVTYTGRYDVWQYSDKGTIPGIPEKVDMNLSYLTY